MNSLQMLVSLIETAIKERTLDKLYGDFLEEALKLGLSSYTLNILIVNTKKKIEDSNDNSDDDLILPFIYRPDIIKQDPEIKVQDKQVVRNKKGYGFIISLVIVIELKSIPEIRISHWILWKPKWIKSSQSRKSITRLYTLLIHGHQPINKIIPNPTKIIVLRSNGAINCHLITMCRQN